MVNKDATETINAKINKKKTKHKRNLCKYHKKEGKEYKNKVEFTCFHFAHTAKIACSKLT